MSRLRPEKIPLLRISGTITEQAAAKVRKRLSSLPACKLLAVSINSRGGLPVQSDVIAQDIKHFAASHKAQVWTFAEDICASGGMWILMAGDRVFVDRASIVGSIGVISRTVDVTGLLDHLGVGHRHQTSDPHSFLFNASPLGGSE